jgi:gluconate 2-dehydrogenase gamma chain
MASERTFPGRRDVLKGLATGAGAAPLSPIFFGGSAAAKETGADSTSPSVGTRDASEGYQSFGPREAAFVEALVNVMCPADDMTPNGVDCGLAVYFDRQLAGAFGKGARLYMQGPWRKGKPQFGYQLPLTPEQFFKQGVAAVDGACKARFGKIFSALPFDVADAFLVEVAADKVSGASVSLASWFQELVYPLFAQACFADPIYGGNRDKIFWRMIGYPGLPAAHRRNMTDFRGKPFPGARNPQSIADFS